MNPIELREAREARGWTISELSRRAHVNRYNLTAVEHWPEHIAAVRAALDSCPVETCDSCGQSHPAECEVAHA